MTIVKDSLQEQIQNLIRTRILSKQYKPGEQILTKAIAEENGVSTMPVRNALQELTSLGLVTNRERVGFFVRVFSCEEAAEIIAVRRMYECYCLQTFFGSLDIHGLERIYNTIKSDADAPDFPFQQLDDDLHRIFVNASHNNFLITKYTEMCDLFRLFAYKNINHNAVANREHLKILRCILKQDKKMAIQALEEHLDRVQEETAAAIESEGAAASG